MRSVRIAAVQFGIRPYRSPEHFFEHVEHCLFTARSYRADFVLFPELFSLTLFSALKQTSTRESVIAISQYNEQLIAKLDQFSQSTGMTVIGGSIPVFRNGRLQNESPITIANKAPSLQPKLHMTRYEKDVWKMEGGDALSCFESEKAKFAVTVCYDVEFPEQVRAVAQDGIDLLFVPHWTSTRYGFERVRCCAKARAVENECYVVLAGLVGGLPGNEALDLNYSRAAIFSPSDYLFPTDGIVAESDSNVETVLVIDLNLDLLERQRRDGTVTPLADRRIDLF